ncbi:MAG: hypothetical protein QM655_11965 [Nocardioidaceae bacterium]
MSDMPRHHRPAFPGAARFESLVGDDDPAVRSEAADRCAALLVRGAHGSADAALVDRVLHLAETEGLDTLADLWSGSPADSLAGCLWRLYLIRSWVHADPAGVAREFDEGRRHTPVKTAVAGVEEPPGPDEVLALADQVLRGVVQGDFADTLFRAAAFVRVTAAGRAHLPDPGGQPEEQRRAADLSAARLISLADQLDAAGHLELNGTLG